MGHVEGRWLCPIHFKIGVGKARRSRVLLPKASSRFRRNGATTGASVATLGRTGTRCNKPRGLSAAVDRPHNLLLKGSSAVGEEPVQQTTTQETLVEASQLLEGLEQGTTIAAVHDLLLQASQQLAVTGLAKCQRHWLLQRR